MVKKVNYMKTLKLQNIYITLVKIDSLQLYTPFTIKYYHLKISKNLTNPNSFTLQHNIPYL